HGRRRQPRRRRPDGYIGPEAVGLLGGPEVGGLGCRERGTPTSGAGLTPPMPPRLTPSARSIRRAGGAGAGRHPRLPRTPRARRTPPSTFSAGAPLTCRRSPRRVRRSSLAEGNRG